jgi:hypothetical protein
MWLGPQAGIIVDDDSLLRHPQPLAKMVGMLAHFTLCSGASQFVYQRRGEECEMYFVIQNKRCGVRPPPEAIRKYLVPVVKSVIGIDLGDKSLQQQKESIIRVTEFDDDWPMKVVVHQDVDCERITFEIIDQREPDFDLVAGLDEAVSE